MGNVFIALMFAVGAGVWVANWFNKRTGGNSQKSYTGGVAVGVFVFIVMVTLLSMVS